MKRVALFILAVGVLAGCGSPRAAVQHAKPDSAPVARPLAQTRVAISQTRAAVSQANATATKAAESSAGVSQRAAALAQVAANVAETGIVAKSAEGRALAEKASLLAGEVEQLKGDLFRVTVQLREAEQAAAEAEQRNAEAERKLVEFDALVATQTAELNQREIALMGARAEKELALAAMEEAEGKLRAIRLKVAAWVALAVLILAGGFYFKLLRFGA